MYIELSSSVVRTALRIYFMIGLVVIALLGDMCCDYRNKLRLLRGQQVMITNMTGWLRGAQLIKSAFQLRRIPGGYLGILMVFTGLIALLSDLATSGFVHTVSRPSRCPFTRGLALNDTVAMYPSMLGTPYFHASSSQLVSWTNGGSMGIYSKANYTADFRADEEDMVGTWNCTDNGQSISYLTTLYNDADIVTDVTDTDYFYNIWNTTTHISPYGGDSFTRQSLMVSTSAVGSADGWSETFWGAFEVKFLVDLYDDLEGRTKIMQPVHCTSRYSSQAFVVDFILARIDAPDILDTWLSGIQGQLYEGYDSVSILGNYLVTLEWILNSMTMVAGAANSVNYSAEGLHPITYYDAASTPAVYTHSDTVGCLKPYALVPLPVIVLFCMTTGLAVYLVSYIAWLLISVRRASHDFDKAAFAQSPLMNTWSPYTPIGGNRKSIDSAEVRKSTPNGLVDWMQHAVHETGVEQKRPRTSHLRKWQFTTDAANRRGSSVGLVNSSLSVEQAMHSGPRPNEISLPTQNSPPSGPPPTNGSSPRPMFTSPPQMYSPEPPAFGVRRHGGYERLRAESHDYNVRDFL